MNKRKFSMIMAIAMLLIWFTPTVNAASLLRVGSRGSQVKELQNKLNELGYNCGKADGIFGSRTQKAVKDFQRANGLSVDGIVGPKTLAALYDGKTSSNATSPSKPTSSSNSSASITSTLRRGSRGSQVKELQNKLNELGYNCGKADGIFGANTESAVKKFQKAKGLSVDGIVGPNTVAALYNTQSRGSSTSTSKSSTSKPSTSNKVLITSTLRRGSRGSQVIALQNKLNELGYNCGTADGIFGASTESAVKKFQKAKGLSVDGIVGQKTIAALYSEDQTSNDKDTSPKPSTPTEPKPSTNSKVPITSTLRRGSRGSQVVALQKRLNELGYNCGTADGIFGASTESAVKKFQKAKGLGVDGIVGQKTIAALYSEDQTSNDKGTSPKPSTPPEPKPPTDDSKVPITSTLRRGSRGSQVVALQKRLNELGYNCGKADGIFGANTESAVKKFQKAKGLSVDGIVGQKTIAALNNKNQTSNDKGTSPKPSTPPKPKPSTDSKIPITSTLRRGSRGSQVVALQKRLNELGYNCGTADGIFGASTESAVKKFQKAKGLSVDGIVGQKTIAALFPVSKPIPNNSYKQFYGKAGALKDKIVVIDPGHGGKDPGASREKINEKDIVLDISLRLERMLKEAGATVIMTRDKDVFEELYYRSAIANKEMLKTEIKKLESAIDELDSQIATLDAELKKFEEKLNKLCDEETIAEKSLNELSETDNGDNDGRDEDTELTSFENEDKEEEKTALEQEKTALEQKKTALEQKKKEFEGYINVLDKNPNQIPQDVKKVLFELADTEYRENMVFVSIHVNSTEATSQTSASGIRIYYTASNEHNEQSRVEFAQTLLNELKKSTDFSKTSSKPIEGNLAVLRGHNFVSALVEAGFINNPNDLQKLVEAQTREDIAAGIYNGIVAHFNKK